MTNVLVCIKRVPESSAEVVLTPDGMSIDSRHVGCTISPHEECAVELATQIASATGGSSTVLTLGGADAVEQLRGALAGGVDHAILVEADPDAFGPADVARAIADVVRASPEAVDLVLLGNDAADTGDFQVGIRLAYLLGRPVVAGASTVSVDGDVASVVADTAEGTAVYELPLPAVVTVLEGGVTPRYPSLIGRSRARKVPIQTVAPGFQPAGSGRARLRIPPPVASEVEILGVGAAAAPAVVATLRQLGVVRR